MAEFERLFNKAFELGYIFYDNDFQKATDMSFHSYMFSEYLRKEFQIDLTSPNRLDFYTWDNFLQYLTGSYLHDEIKSSLLPEEKIDLILTYFTSRINNGSVLYFHVLANILVNEQKQMSFDDLRRCLNQLVKDEMLNVEINELNSAKYSLTWDGEYYQRKGGYKWDLERDERLRENELKNYEMTRRLNTLTIILAITSGVGAIYSIIQIIEYFR